MERVKFEPLTMSIRHVGKRIKSTKLKYTWEFMLKGKKFTIDLYVSRISGKRRIFINSNLYAEEKRKRFSVSEFYLKFGDTPVLIQEKRENIFDLIIENTSFETEILIKRQTASEHSAQRIEQNVLFHNQEEKGFKGIPESSQDILYTPSAYIYESPPPSNPSSAFSSQYTNKSWGNGKFK